MSQPPPILLQRDGAIARLTLNRPASGNLVDLDMAKALMDVAIECDEDASIRCVLLAGSGRFFSVGGDVMNVAIARCKCVAGHVNAIDALLGYCLIDG